MNRRRLKTTMIMKARIKNENLFVRLKGKASSKKKLSINSKHKLLLVAISLSVASYRHV